MGDAMKYAKAIVGLLGAVAAALAPLLSDGSAEWVGIVLALLTGGAVAGVRNRAPQPLPTVRDES